jgi:pyruvate dehydrogenase E2 component (dihydrolipoamide acetyltransferase)
VAAPAEAAEPKGGETLEPMTVMRKAIAEHMIRSVQTSAHVTTIFEVDMSKVVAIRSRLKEEYEAKHGVRLTFLAFICRAVVDALGKWPRMNAEIRGDQIALKSFVNLGIAVALDEGRGLIVPVILNAEEKNLLGITRAIADLAERARTKKLVPDEVQGGTFTITNPGGFGAIGGTPIINQPQVGIIDVEAIVKRPVVIVDELGNDSIGIRPMMNLCLSYDHRLVDGAYAAPFMRDVKTNLETWEADAY